ncbi:MAG: hypothetical protein DRJ28_06615 [Actinobacteria bacterium]|nr:MAG: hypothetical protein DRJ28_06615 [Actinomycetota bacterium]
MSISAAVATRKSGVDTGDLDLSEVSVRMMPHWMHIALGGSVAAITLGNSIFVAQDGYEAVVSGKNPGLLVHELVHVDQWRREGRVAFVSRYAIEYARNRLIGLDHRTAYRAIGFEVAAYDVSERALRDVA